MIVKKSYFSLLTINYVAHFLHVLDTLTLHRLMTMKVANLHVWQTI